ncbi:MAG: hypothetical protein Q4G16_11650 [Cruoricaptor ignavus]|nr:hypothetical protein [Cruoricaptor ignavus]
MKIKYLSIPLLLAGATTGLYSQLVGIGTRTSVATLDVVTKSSLATSPTLKIINTDNNNILTAQDNGDLGIGKSSHNPVAQLTIFGINNNGTDSQSSYRATYPDSQQNWDIYINPKQNDLNPAYPGFISLIFDNDGIKNQYFTTNNYGTFFGHHVDRINSGLFFAEVGTTLFSTYRLSPTSPYLTTRQATAYTNGSLRIADENKGYVAGGTCTNPGTIAFNSTNDNFLGCVEIYNADGTNSGEKIWKKLNNN